MLRGLRVAVLACPSNEYLSFDGDLVNMFLQESACCALLSNPTYIFPRSFARAWLESRAKNG